MIEIKPYMFREKTDTGQTKWKVIDKRGKMIIVTSSEDIADQYYLDELKKFRKLKYSASV